MGKQGVDFDLDELWPPAGDLIALQFATEEELGHCQAVLRQHLDRYQAVNKWDLVMVVRKADLHLLRDAGLSYTPVELTEAEPNPSREERAERHGMMKRYMGLWLQELGWDKR